MKKIIYYMLLNSALLFAQTQGIYRHLQPIGSASEATLTGALQPRELGIDSANRKMVYKERNGALRRVLTKEMTSPSFDNSVTFSSGATISGTATIANAVFSGTLTLNALTANRVLQLDGSKNIISNTITGSGSIVASNSPTITGTVGGSPNMDFSSATVGGVNVVTTSGTQTLTNKSISASQITQSTFPLGIFQNTEGSNWSFPSTSANDLAGSNSGLVVYQFGSGTNANNSAFMTFHRAGIWAEQFGLDINNKFYHGGWSRGANKYYLFSEFNKPNASNITAGTFGTGNYTFPNDLVVNGSADIGNGTYNRTHQYLLNKAVNGWNKWADRVTNLGEATYNLNFIQYIDFYNPSNAPNSYNGLRGTIADNDAWYVGGRVAGGSNDGQLYIGTGDDGSEPIVFGTGNPSSPTMWANIQNTGVTSVNGVFSNSGQVRATNPGGQGTYLELAKYQGSLPGYPSSYYPTLKTDWDVIYFAAVNKYLGAIGNNGTYHSFEVRNLANDNYDIALRTDDQSSFIRTGKFGIGNNSPSYTLDISLGSGNTVSKHGSNKPIYLIQQSPSIGFNSYFNSGWKFGNNSSSNYAGYISLSETTGKMEFNTATTPGNTDGAVTVGSGMWLDKDSKLGIKTSTPDSTLTVIGSVRINDNLKVEDKISTNNNELFDYDQGEFTVEWEGNVFSPDETSQINFVRIGRQVTLTFEPFSGTSAGIQFYTLDGELPADLRPAGTWYGTVTHNQVAENAGLNIAAVAVKITSSGLISLAYCGDGTAACDEAGWDPLPLDKGIVNRFSVTYTLD